MGWELRNGRPYYYRKERVGGSVVSRYVGNGETANLIAAMESSSKGALTALRALKENEQEEAKEREKEFAAYFADVEAVFQQAMTAAGYHRHKRGEWRKRRGTE